MSDSEALDLGAVFDRHAKGPRSAGLDRFGCDQVWPCDAFELIAEVERLRALDERMQALVEWREEEIHGGMDIVEKVRLHLRAVEKRAGYNLKRATDAEAEVGRLRAEVKKQMRRVSLRQDDIERLRQDMTSAYLELEKAIASGDMGFVGMAYSRLGERLGIGDE